MNDGMTMNRIKGGFVSPQGELFAARGMVSSAARGNNSRVVVHTIGL